MVTCYLRCISDAPWQPPLSNHFFSVSGWFIVCFNGSAFTDAIQIKKKLVLTLENLLMAITWYVYILMQVIYIAQKEPLGYCLF